MDVNRQHSALGDGETYRFATIRLFKVGGEEEVHFAKRDSDEVNCQGRRQRQLDSIRSS